MKLLSIVHYDTASEMQGGIDALVEIPEGRSEDEVFLAWLKVERKDPELTMKKVNDNDGYLYTWGPVTVVTWESLQK
jgi:hypothetical protein